MKRLSHKIVLVVGFLAFTLMCVCLVNLVNAEEWVSPTSNDSTNWSNPANAYDDNTGTNASKTFSVGATTGELPLVLPYSLSTNTIQYYASSTVAASLEIELYNGTAWVPVFSGIFTQNQWNNVTFTSMPVSKVRFEMWHPTLSGTGYLHECDVLTTNAIPIVGEFQSPTTAYANQYFLVNATGNDADGKTTIVNMSLSINGSIILKWDNATNTFSEYSDVNGYCTLDVANCIRTSVNNTAWKISWKIKLYWNYSEGSIFVLNTDTKIFDDQGASTSGATTFLFTFEDDLIIQSAALSESYSDPSSSISLDALTYYQGTSTAPEDATGITGYIELSGVQKGSDTSINTTGYFTITFNSEATVLNYTYNVYVATDENSVQNKTVWNVVDSVTVNIAVADNRIDINTNATILVTGTYDFDSAVFDGSFTLNYTTYNHATVCRHNYTVSSISGDSRGITTISTNDEDYVVWDRIKIASGGYTNSYQHVGENTTVYFLIQYEHDLANVTDGTVLVNGTAMTYNASLFRWELEFTQATLGSYNYTVTSVSGNAYGITVLNDLAGPKQCVFYANLNLRTIDTDGNPILTTCIVYFYNGSIVTFGSSSIPTQSNGTAVVGAGTTWFTQTVSNGWANWTGQTASSLQVYVTWYGLTVNSTFPLSLTTDMTMDVNCLCYPFTYEGTIYHAASDAAITSCSYGTYMLTIQFSGAVSTYVLCVSGPQPTYLLNVTYNLALDYTTYLQIAHYANATIKINYQDWGGTYIRKTDQLMTDVTFVSNRLTLNFSGTVSDIGEVRVTCGSRGTPSSTNGFTSSSVVGGVFIGYYTFSETNKQVWLQFSIGSGPGGGGTVISTPSLWVYLVFDFPEIAFTGQTVQGTLNISWSGEQSIKLMEITLEKPFDNWVITGPLLPMVFTMNKTADKGEATLLLNLTCPKATALGEYSIPCTTNFVSLTTGITRSARNFIALTLITPQTPIPSLFIFATLSALGLVAFAGFARIKSKRSKALS